MTQTQRIWGFCLGVGFLIGVPFLAFGLVVVGLSVFAEARPVRGWPLLVPLLAYGLAAWYRRRHRSLGRSSFLAEIVASILLGPVLVLVILALLWAAGGAD